MNRFAGSALAFCTFALLACSSVEATKLPGGGYRILCEKGMGDCVARAEKICGGKGYTILAGQNATKRVGGSSSSYQDVLYIGELAVACGSVAVKEPACKSPEGEVHDIGGAAAPAATPARLCIPGAAQGCVGPGGCQGGQSCLADGSGFAACDCGSSSAVSTPAVAPAPAAPTTPPSSGPNPPALPGAAPPAERLRAP